MSIGVGTLQPRARVAKPVWPVALVAVVFMMAIVVVAATSGREGPLVPTAVGRPLVNTPSELGGGIASSTPLGGTIANTPSELNGGAIGGFALKTPISAGSSSLAVAATPAVMAAIIGSRNAADAHSSEPGGGTGNTPSELRGGYAPDASDRAHQQR